MNDSIKKKKENLISLINKMKIMMVQNKYDEVIAFYKEYDTNKQKDIEEYIHLTELYVLALRVKGRFKEAYEKLQYFEDHIEDLHIEYLKVLILITKLYTVANEGKQDEANNLFDYWNETFKKFEPTNNIEKSIKATVYHVQGIIYLFNDDKDNSIEHCEKSIKLREKLINNDFDVLWQKRSIGVTYYNLSQMYSQDGDYDRSLEFAKKSYENQKELHSDFELAYGASAYGYSFLESGKTNEAMKLFKEAYDSFKKSNSIFIVQYALGPMVNCCLLIGDYDKAHSYISEMEQFKEKLDETGKTSLFHLKASYFRSIGEFQKSIDFYNKSLAVIEKYSSKNRIYKMWNLLNQANVFVEMNNILKARELAEIVLNYSKTSENKLRMSDFNGNLELLAVFIKLGETEIADEIFQRLTEIKNSLEEEKHFMFFLKYKFTHALLIKSKLRLKDKLSAINEFKKVIENSISIYNNIAIKSIINLIDLLFLEYHSDPNSEIIKDIKENLDKMAIISEEQQNNAFKVEALILKSKLSIIEGDSNSSLGYLTEALSITEKNELNFYKQKVISEFERVSKEIDKQSLDKVEVKKRFDIAQIESYIQEIMRSNILEQSKSS